MDILFYGLVKGFEPARKEGETKGYLKCYDKEAKTDFEVGCRFPVDEEALPPGNHRWHVSGVRMRNGTNGVYLTADNLQLVDEPPVRNGRRGEPAATAEA